MADNNKNILIDIEINASGQQQLHQYKAAFEGLKTSVNNLSNPIDKLNGEISKLSGSVGQLNTQTGFISDSALKVRDNFIALKAIFKGVEDGIAMLKAGTLSFTTVLTGGLSILLTFAPEIISLVSSFFKGKDAVAQMTDKLKGFNEIMKAASSDAATQTAKLNLLYKSATAVKNCDEVWFYLDYISH
jgi:uncharacterized protein YoxC